MSSLAQTRVAGWPGIEDQAAGGVRGELQHMVAAGMEREEVKRALMAQILGLQQQVIDRDMKLHQLNQERIRVEAEKSRQQELKRGFSAVSRKNVDTSSVDIVMREASRLFLYTLASSFGGTAGINILDVPYNRIIGATATSYKNARCLLSHWGDLDDRTPAELCRTLEDVEMYAHVITQRRGKLFSAWELERMGRGRGAALTGVETLLVAPIVVGGDTIAIVVLVNGDYGDGDAVMLEGVLPELWTSNIAQLINDALDYRRQLETEDALVAETKLRDEFILSLDSLLDRVVKTAQADGDVSTDQLWRNVLRAVCDFFEEYFSADCLLAVTNAESNFKVQSVVKERSSYTAGGSTNRRESEASRTANVDGLEFVYYSFSSTLRTNIKNKSQHRGMRTPKLSHAHFMRKTLDDGKPYYTEDTSHLKLPANHMKMKSMLLVPIIFLEEVVGMLGLVNGNFTAAHGRVLQSVFGTFWSMITKTTLLTESQGVLNATFHPQITERVKQGEVVADRYDNATVLFADIVGFTDFTRELRPIHVVEYSNLIFNQVDTLVTEFGLEKIKVIGDCYMAVGGIQDKDGSARKSADDERNGQAREMCLFALKLLERAAYINANLASLKMHHSIREGFKHKPLRFRVGISGGPLMAGVFGTQKLQYDVLGQTVTNAASLEGLGAPGKVHVCPKVVEYLEGMGCTEFVYEKRAPVTVKGRGLVQTYFLTAAGEDAVAGAGEGAGDGGMPGLLPRGRPPRRLSHPGSPGVLSSAAISAEEHTHTHEPDVDIAAVADTDGTDTTSAHRSVSEHGDAHDLGVPRTQSGSPRTPRLTYRTLRSLEASEMIQPTPRTYGMDALASPGDCTAGP